MLWALGLCLALFAFQTAAFWRQLALSALDGESLRLWLSHGLLPLLLAGGLWLAAWVLGRRLLALLKAPDDGVAAAALGLGALGQGAFVLALAGALNPLSLASLALGAAAAGRWGLPRPRAPRWSPWEGLAMGLLAYAGLWALLRALAPPVEWDVRAYHLALPELYLREGRLLRVPWIVHAHWPRLMELLYALPLALGRDGAAALLHGGTAALLVAGVYRASGGGAAGLCAALLLAGQPALQRSASTAHADSASALFAFAAALLLARWERLPSRGTLWAAGLLAGLCASAKMTGLAALAGGSAAVWWRVRRPREPAEFALAGALMAGPWLALTAAWTGDPFWPFLRLDGDSAALAARYLRSNLWDFPPPSWLLSHDGPLLLLLPAAAAAAFARPWLSPLERVLLWSAPFYLMLSWRHHEAWRFLMPLWPALALIAGRGAAALLERGRWRRALAAAALAFGAGTTALLSPNNELFAVLAQRPSAEISVSRREHWEDRALGVTAFYREARAALPANARVLLFREVRGYGAGFDYLWGDPKNQALIDYRRLRGPDDLHARLKELGVTHVLDNPPSSLYQEDPGYYDRRTLALMREMLQARARLVVDRGMALHELL